MEYLAYDDKRNAYLSQTFPVTFSAGCMCFPVPGQISFPDCHHLGKIAQKCCSGRMCRNWRDRPSEPIKLAFCLELVPGEGSQSHEASEKGVQTHNQFSPLPYTKENCTLCGELLHNITICEGDERYPLCSPLQESIMMCRHSAISYATRPHQLSQKLDSFSMCSLFTVITRRNITGPAPYRKS